MIRHLVKNRKSELINKNASDWVRKYKLEMPEGTVEPKSLILVRLVNNKKVIGGISIQDVDREHAFDESDVRLLETLANAMSVALQNAQSFKAEQERVAELAIINSVQEGLASKLDIQEIYELVGEHVQKIFNNADISFGIYDPNTDMATGAYVSVQGKRVHIDPFKVDNKGFLGALIRDRKTICVNKDTARIAKKYKSKLVIEGPWPKSVVYVPLVIDQLVRGALILNDYQKENAFSDSDVRLLETLASSTSVALQNALSFKAEQERVAELAIINSVQEGLASKLNLQGIYDLVGDKLYEIFKPEILYIAIYHPETNRTSYPYAIGRGEKGNLPETGLGGFTGEAIHKRKTIVVNEDIERREAEVGSYNMSEGPDPQSMVYIPIIAGNDVLGVVSLQSYERGYIFPESEVRLMETLTSSMSVALQNAQSFKAEQERVAELQIINSIQQGLAAELDFQAIVDLVGDKIRDVFDAQGVIITNYDNTQNLVSFPYYLFRGKRVVQEGWTLGKGLISHVIQSRQPLVINQNASKRFQELGAIYVPTETEDTTKSWLAVPMIVGNIVIGCITLENYERENAFSDPNVRLLTTIAASLGTALENARLFDETQQRNAELAIINAVQEGLASKLDMQAIYDLVGDKLRDIFKADSTWIAFHDEKRETIHVPYFADRSDKKPNFTRPYGKGLYEPIVESGKPLRVGSAKEAAELGGSYRVPSPGSKKDLNESFMGVPIFKDGVAIGATSVQSYKQNAFGESDLRLLTTLTNSMSVALEGARLFDEVQKRNAEITENLEQQTATSDILRVIAESPTDFQPVFDTIIERATKLCGGAAGFAYHVSDGMIHLIADYDISPESNQIFRDLFPRPIDDDAESNVIPVIRNREILHMTDHKTDPRSSQINREMSIRFGVGAALYLPLVKDNEGIGAFGIFRKETVPFSEKEIALIQTFASQAVIAIENVRLFNELQQRNAEITESLERETASNDILRVIAESPTDIAPVLDVIARNAAQLSGSEDAIIGIADGDMLRVDAHYGDIPMLPVGEGIRFDRDSVAGRAIIDGIPVQSVHNQRGVKSEFPAGDKVAKKYGYKMTCAVPLMREGKAIGAISVRRTKPELLTEKQVALIQSFANQAAIAVANVRLFEAEQQRVAELQIINTVQEGLAKQLDFRGIVDLISEKVGEIFKADTANSGIYDADRDWISHVYYVDRGERITLPEGPAQRPSLAVHMLDTRQPILAGTSEETDKLGSVRQPRSGEKADKNESYLGVPIMTGDKPIGIIAVQSYKQNAYNQDDLRLMQTLANSMSVALENARLFDETQRLLKETEQRNAELAIINSIQLGLASKLDIQAIVKLIGDEVKSIFRGTDVEISIFDPANNMVTFPYWWSVKDGMINAEPLPLGKGLHSKLVQTRQPILLKTAEEVIERGGAMPAGYTIRKSFLGVPILSGEHVIGGLSLHDAFKENRFSESDLRLLTTLANSMSVALENAHLFDETQRLLKETEERNAELAVINSVQGALAAELDMQGIYDAVGDKIRDVFDAQIVTIVSYDRANEHNIIHYAIENGERHTYDPQPTTDMYRELMDTGKPIIVQENLAERILGKALPMKGSKGHDSEVPKSGVWIPLTASGTVTGHVSLQNVDRENAFSKSDIRLLTTLANSMSVALESARLFDETQRLLKETEERNAELAVITSVQQGLATKLEYQSIVDLIGGKIQDIFNSQAVGIGIYSDSLQEMEVLYFVEKNKRYYPNSIQVHENGILRYVHDTGKTVYIRNGDQDEEYDKYGVAPPGTLPETEPPKSLLFVPLVLSGKVFGAITLQNMDQYNAFTDSDIRLLETIANSMSVALENARLFDETQRLLKETEQRNAELAIVNSVQLGLASKLDMQAIFELVGEKIRTIFDAQSTIIATYEYEKEQALYRYVVEKGERFDGIAMSFNGFHRKMIQERKTILYNENLVEQVRALGYEESFSDNDLPKSALNVPLLVGNQVLG
ncbi:MAG TPA: GAF domain-containing protein, partial [Anaerolineales bacterium]